jgi:hypothetical protein
MTRVVILTIPDVQRRAFEMCSFESADFQMSPSDIDIKLNLMILFILQIHRSNLKGFTALPMTNFYQSMNCIA